MTETVVIAFPRSFEKAQKIAEHLGATLHPYDGDVFARVWESADRIVALMATGIVIRSITPLLQDKWIDPAVVVVSPDLMYAVPLIGGHHGANELAQELTLLGIQPVITTATEVFGRESVETIAKNEQKGILNRASTRAVNAAILEGEVPVHAVTGPAIVIAGFGVSVLLRQGEFIIGIGCRKGIQEDEVIAAVEDALIRSGLKKESILACATTNKKIHEQGLLRAAGKLPANLVFLDDVTINAQKPVSPSKASRIGLAGVAEPCALALSRYHELVLNKIVYGRVTIAIAR